MLQRHVNKYLSIYLSKLNTSAAEYRSWPTKDVMSTSAAAAGSNDTVVNSIAQELVCSGKIKIRLIPD